MGSSSSKDAGAPAYNIAGVGMPIVTEGRLRNYVFVTLRLQLGAGQTPETMRAKEAYFRDAIVRAGHKWSFGAPGDWTRLDETALIAGVMAAGTVICGRGAVTGVEIVSQTARRRTGVLTAA